MIDTLPAKDDEPRNLFKKKNKIVDFADETQKVIQKANKLIKKKDIEGAVELILVQEKKARLASDFKSVEVCCKAILLTYNKQKDFENVNKYISFLCKRRNQSETVQTAIVTLTADRIIPKIEDKKAKEETIVLLRELSTGKIMLEVKRAELTRVLSDMKQAEGDLVAACNVLNEETPETYTSMERSDKINYILEQTSLCLKIKDYIRAKILLKKIDVHSLEQLHDLKVRFYRLTIDYSEANKEPLEAAKAHLAVYKSLKDGAMDVEDSSGISSLSKVEHLKRALIYLACSKYSNEQVDIIHRLLNDHEKALKEQLDYFHFIKHFVESEVVQWPFPEHEVIVKNELLKEEAAKASAVKKNKQNEAMEVESEANSWAYKMLFDRIVQHDIRVISKYYSCIFLSSLADILKLKPNKVEEYISDMVSEGDIKVKIDRADGIINFKEVQSPDQNLTEWTSNINQLMSLVDKTCHLIHKEKMLSEAKKKA